MTGIHCATKMPTTPKKKKRGLMHNLYAAFFGSRHTLPATKKPESPKTTASTISMIVSSIHPFHIADGGVQSPPPPPPPPLPTFTPASPAAASSVAGTKTSYASADFGDKVFELDEDLKTREIKEDEAENDVVQEEEDEVIGRASAMMIGMFYQKIRTQALNSIGVVRG